MKIEAAPRFNRIAKKLTPAIKQALDKGVLALVGDPYKGDRKKGALRGVLVEKFEAATAQWLLAYRVVEKDQVIQLLYFGRRENFYRDLTQYLETKRPG